MKMIANGKLALAETPDVLRMADSPAAAWQPKNFLLAMYELESSGNDAHTNGYNLTPVNTPTFVAGKVGNAANLVSASNQYFSLADASDLFGGMTKLSLSFWIKPTTAAPAGYVQKAGATIAFYVFNAFGTDIRFQVQPNGFGSTSVTHTTAISAGNWFHVVAVYDGTVSTLASIKFYVNLSKVSQNTSTGTGALSSGSGAAFLVGNRSSDLARRLNGIIDQVSIWSGYCLTDADVTWLYNSGNGRAYAEYS